MLLCEGLFNQNVREEGAGALDKASREERVGRGAFVCWVCDALCAWAGGANHVDWTDFDRFSGENSSAAEGGANKGGAAFPELDAFKKREGEINLPIRW